MRYVFSFVLIFILAAAVFSEEPSSASGSDGSVTGVLPYNTEKFDLIASTKPDPEEQKQAAMKKKSGFKAALMSAILPGAGEFYAESYWKSALFAVIEIAAVTSAIVYENKGDDEDLRMRRFGDEHWSEQKYWSYVYQVALREDLWDQDPLALDENDIIVNEDYDQATVAQLRDIERNAGIAGFTHSLPETKTQQYYEMIYKYLHQFGAGWDDAPSLLFYGSQEFPYTLTPNVSEYRKMRNRSNDYYQTATTMVSVVMLNHLVSAFDAAYSVKRYNKKVEYAFQVSARRYAGEIVRTYGIHISW